MCDDCQSLEGHESMIYSCDRKENHIWAERLLQTWLSLHSVFVSLEDNIKKVSGTARGLYWRHSLQLMKMVVGVDRCPLGECEIAWLTRGDFQTLVR